MSDVKSQKRRYQSDLRKAQAAETREAMLTAADDLFRRRGWVAATIADIAAASRVSKETVYAVFRNKKAVLRELIVRAVRGTDPKTPLIQQEATRSIAKEADQARQIELFAAGIAKVLERVAPLMDVARAAAETDQAMAKLYEELQRGRLNNLEWFANALARTGPLRDNMDPGAAGRIIWRLASPDLFMLIRNVEGASQETYVDWLATSLKLLLLTR
ncbi:TetR/AcrR family transcriptional regulator [Pelagibacterium limicola]|uniref:TetR/AcrR family transcriptional regulator n=1 Tax=Pelagibacterium limicola TaxID=2791022 RepID=UPI0018B013C5|nr:TetR family transcriptional regulator [Pelagibacterium limicola]